MWMTSHIFIKLQPDIHLQFQVDVELRLETTLNFQGDFIMNLTYAWNVKVISIWTSYVVEGSMYPEIAVEH